MTRKEQIEKYWGLVDVVLDNLLTKASMRQYRYLRDDLHSEGTMGMIKAIDTYQDKGATLVTYISLKVRGHVLDFLRKHRLRETPPCDINIIYETTIDETEPYVEGDNDLVEKYEPSNPIDKMIYHQVIMGGLTYKEVADHFDITRNSVKLRKKRLINRLRKQMTVGTIV